jgi:hypothetical protein
MTDVVFAFVSYAFAACAMCGRDAMPRSRAGCYVYLVLLTRAGAGRSAADCARRPDALASALRRWLRVSFGSIRGAAASVWAQAVSELLREWGCRAEARDGCAYTDRFAAWRQSIRYRVG